MNESATVSPPRTGGVVVELVGAGRLELVHRDRPEPAPGEVAVAVTALGICGTDLHYFSGRRPTAYPLVLGHDLAGKVTACGAGVETSLIGRRVTIDPTVSCGHCSECRAGRPVRCASHGYLGMTFPGCLAEYITISARQIVPLLDTVGDDAATVLEPVAVALELLDRVARLVPGPVPTAVVGGGPLGIVVASLLGRRGWPVIVYEPSERRRAAAAGVGVEARPPEDASQLESPGLVVETSATSAGVDVVDAVAAPHSLVAVVGGAPTGLPMRRILGGDLTVLAVVGGAGRYPEAVNLVASGAVAGRELITDRHPFTDAQVAFDAVASDKERVVRALLEQPWEVAP